MPICAANLIGTTATAAAALQDADSLLNPREPIGAVQVALFHASTITCLPDKALGWPNLSVENLHIPWSGMTYSAPWAKQ